MVASSTRDSAGWILVGGFAAVGFGAVAVRSGSVALGLAVLTVITGWTVGARWSWQRRAVRVPATEYLAAVWSLAYITLLLALRAVGNDYHLGDALFVFPPIGVLPVLARTLLGDDGASHDRARSVAYHLHRLCGWTLTALGVLLVVSLYFIIVAPLSLTAGLLHIWAASEYRRLRASDAPVDAGSRHPAGG